MRFFSHISHVVHMNQGTSKYNIFSFLAHIFGYHGNHLNTKFLKKLVLTLCRSLSIVVFCRETPNSYGHINIYSLATWSEYLRLIGYFAWLLWQPNIIVTIFIKHCHLTIFSIEYPMNVTKTYWMSIISNQILQLYM